VFWHNLARTTWSLSPDGERAILAHRKGNNYRRLGRFAVEVTWLDGYPREVACRPYQAVLADRIAEVLTTISTGLTHKAITSALNEEATEDEQPVKANSVLISLRRGLRASPPRFTTAAGSWFLAEAF
jgi:hypothetical protein